MADLQIGRITFSIGERRYEMSGPGLSVHLPDAAAVVAGESQWRLHQEKLRAEGAVTESARVRRELLEAIGKQRSEWSLAKPLGEEGSLTERDIGADAAFAAVLAALDRICPEPEGKE